MWEISQLAGWAAGDSCENMEIIPLWDIAVFCDIETREQTANSYRHTSVSLKFFFALKKSVDKSYSAVYNTEYAPGGATVNNPVKSMGNGKEHTTMKYQICIFGNTANDERAVIHTENIDAPSIKDATETAVIRYNKADIRVYPYCSKTDGEGQLELARHTLASVENWERRNNNAVLNPQRRNMWEREDMIMLACVVINAMLDENPDTTMFDLKTAAFSAICAEQKRKDRNSEREYLPGWSTCNVTPREARATCPKLDNVIREAIKTADMTDGQMSALIMSYQDNLSALEIAEQTGTKRATVYQSLYRAYYKVLCKALEIDGNFDAFTAAGYTPDDVTETLDILRKRARMTKVEHVKPVHIEKPIRNKSARNGREKVKFTFIDNIIRACMN